MRPHVIWHGTNPPTAASMGDPAGGQGDRRGTSRLPREVETGPQNVALAIPQKSGKVPKSRFFRWKATGKITVLSFWWMMYSMHYKWVYRWALWWFDGPLIEVQLEIY